MLHSAHGHMVDTSDFMCGIYVQIHLPYVPVKYMAYIFSLMDIFVSRVYMAIICKVDVVVGYTLAH